MMSTATENGDNGNCDGDGKGNGDGNGGEEEDSDGNDDDGDGDIKIDNMVRRTNQKVMAMKKNKIIHNLPAVAMKTLLRRRRLSRRGRVVRNLT